MGEAAIFTEFAIPVELVIHVLQAYSRFLTIPVMSIVGAWAHCRVPGTLPLAVWAVGRGVQILASRTPTLRTKRLPSKALSVDT